MDQTRGSLETQLDALIRLPAESRGAAAAAMTGEAFVQVLTPVGDVVGSSPQLTGRLVSPDQLPSEARGSKLRRSS